MLTSCGGVVAMLPSRVPSCRSVVTMSLSCESVVTMFLSCEGVVTVLPSRVPPCRSVVTMFLLCEGVVTVLPSRVPPCRSVVTMFLSCGSVVTFSLSCGSPVTMFLSCGGVVTMLFDGERSVLGKMRRHQSLAMKGSSSSWLDWAETKTQNVCIWCHCTEEGGSRSVLST